MEFKRAVILGAGSSSSTPFLTCVLANKDCAACQDALAHPNGRNHRLNPSFLIELRHPADGSTHHVLVDCGKTFRETVLKLFPKLGVRDLSAVLLTHDHADASFGIDDLRELNRKDAGCADGALDVFADTRTLSSMQRMFYYLFPKPSAQPPPAAPAGAASSPPAPAPTASVTDVKHQPWMARLSWHAFAPEEKLELSIASRDATAVRAAWSVVPVPVLHGKGYHCSAFLIPLNACRSQYMLYVSDVSSLEKETPDHPSFLERVCRARASLGDVCARTVLDRARGDSAALEEAVVTHNRAHPLDALVLDLMSNKEYFSHFNTDESITAAALIGAKRTFFVGMSHSLEYKALTKTLHERGVSDAMFVGYDGCVVADAANLSDEEAFM